MARFQDLPPELHAMIWEYMDPERGAGNPALLRTSRRFYQILNPLLYRLNVRRDSSSALIWAAKYNRISTLEWLVANGADVNNLVPSMKVEAEGLWSMRPRGPYTALAVAIKYGRLEAVSWLLDHGADIEAPYPPHSHPDMNGLCRCRLYLGLTELRLPITRTPLHLALCNQHAAIAELLIERGASLDLGQKNDSRPTFLHQAAFFNLETMVEYAILERGMDVESRDDAGFTPVFYATLASFGGEPRALETLIRLGADLNVRAGKTNTDPGPSPLGPSPLGFACFAGFCKSGLVLFRAGARLDSGPMALHTHPGGSVGYPLQSLATFRWDFSYMMEGERRENFFQTMKEDPLEYGNWDADRRALIRELVNTGVSVEGERRFAPLPVAVSFERMHRPIMDHFPMLGNYPSFLISVGADVNGLYGTSTTLHILLRDYYYSSGVEELMVSLLERGARIDIPDKDGLTALHMACVRPVHSSLWKEGSPVLVLLRNVQADCCSYETLHDAACLSFREGHRHAYQNLFAELARRDCDQLLSLHLKELVVTSPDPKSELQSVMTMCAYELHQLGLDIVHKAIDLGEEVITAAILRHFRNVSRLSFGPSFGPVAMTGCLFQFLQFARSGCSDDIVRLLIKNGAQVNSFAITTCRDSGEPIVASPLTTAVAMANIQALRILLNAQANPHLRPPPDMLASVPEFKFYTAFEMGVRMRPSLDPRAPSPELFVAEMLEKASLPPIPPHAKRSYMHDAMMNTEMLQLLLSRGADPNGGSGCDEPLMFLALNMDAWGFDHRRLELLITHGANQYARSRLCRYLFMDLLEHLINGSFHNSEICWKFGHRQRQCLRAHFRVLQPIGFGPKKIEILKP